MIDPSDLIPEPSAGKKSKANSLKRRRTSGLRISNAPVERRQGRGETGQGGAGGDCKYRTSEATQRLSCHRRTW